MKRINLFGIVALVSLVLSACGAPVAATATLPAVPTDTLTPLQPAATPTVNNAPLTTQQLRNMQYSLPFYNRTVSLTDGTYQKGTGSDSYSAMLLDNAVAFGDLDNDGIVDAAVAVVENGGGSGEFEILVAILDQADTPVQAGVVELGDRVQINSSSFKTGRLC